MDSNKTPCLKQSYFNHIIHLLLNLLRAHSEGSSVVVVSQGGTQTSLHVHVPHCTPAGTPGVSDQEPGSLVVLG